MTFTPYTINPDLDLELLREVPVSPEAVFFCLDQPRITQAMVCSPAILCSLG